MKFAVTRIAALAATAATAAVVAASIPCDWSDAAYYLSHAGLCGLCCTAGYIVKSLHARPEEPEDDEFLDEDKTP